MVTAIIQASRRNHWIALLFWIPAQILFGLLLANHGKFEYNGTTFLDLTASLPPSEKLYEYHALSGKALLGFGIWLTFVKLYVVLFKLPRKRIANNFVATGIAHHWSLMLVLLVLQYLTMGEYSVQFSELTGLNEATLKTIHSIVPWFILLELLNLTFQKIYLTVSAPAPDNKKKQ